ncbi:uncharacterized protein LOC129596363 [Paramacrobiotus metropolitanus]|uniref:uncharacterized protein LOC129596363 n=1 Tax=Paramacrobiotus metropolitanus TaxID=2943436 RepID=UPI002445813D|nr:uncharacterized protein LOC129596363 [Paramacrobiotus metropolitanus]
MFVRFVKSAKITKVHYFPIVQKQTSAVPTKSTTDSAKMDVTKWWMVTVLIFPALFLIQVKAGAAATLPHNSCRSSSTPSEGWLMCTAGNYSIPDNFDVQKVPLTINSMDLGGGRDNTTIVPNNIIQDYAEPLPANLTSLIRLNIYNFAGANGTRLPVEKFLANVRVTLLELEMSYCRIGTLSADFLKGFENLRLLTIFQNDISSIDLTAFETASTPVLEEIDLMRNKIADLDWTVFKPVAETLRKLDLSEQFRDIDAGWVFEHNASVGMQRITLSQRFTFARLTTLDMRRNALNFLSRDVLDTLNPSRDARFSLDNNAFCPVDPTKSCSCCEARDFVQWMYEVGTRPQDERPVQISFTCVGGFHVWQVWGGIPSLPQLGQYECCSNTTVENCIQTDPPSPGGGVQRNYISACWVVLIFVLSGYWTIITA